jgi:hypothetical protein
MSRGRRGPLEHQTMLAEVSVKEGEMSVVDSKTCWQKEENYIPAGEVSSSTRPGLPNRRGDSAVASSPLLDRQRASSTPHPIASQFKQIAGRHSGH